MFTTKQENDILIIETTEQRLDMVIARRFKDKLNEAISNKPKKIIINLEKTNYFDSSALGALVAFLRDVKGYGGHLVLCNLSRSLYALLKLSKLDILFDIRNNMHDAIEYFNHTKKDI
jgi:anti-sigma B factor antagonist